MKPKIIILILLLSLIMSIYTTRNISNDIGVTTIYYKGEQGMCYYGSGKLIDIGGKRIVIFHARKRIKEEEWF